MNKLKRNINIAALSAVLILGGTAQGQAATLEVVIMNSLWGTAVGGIAGLSIGLLDEDDKDTIFSKYMAKGMAVGALGGLLCGLLDPALPYYGHMYLNNGQPKGLLHFDADTDVLTVRPAKIIPRREFSANEDDISTWRFDLFTTTF